MLEMDVPDMPMGIGSLGKVSGSVMGASKGANNYFRVDARKKERAKGA